MDDSRRYTTQMDAARQGILTPQMEIVAKKEQMDPAELMALVAAGKVAIPANRLIPAWIQRASARCSAPRSM